MVSNIDSIIQQLKSKASQVDQRVEAMKECEKEILVLEDDIAELKRKESNLKNDYIKKQNICDQRVISLDLAKQQEHLLSNLLEQNENLKSEEVCKVEAMQESVCRKRLMYCNEVRDLVNKLEFLIPQNIKHVTSYLTMKKVPINARGPDELPLRAEIESLKLQLTKMQNLLSHDEQLELKKIYLQADPVQGEEFRKLKEKLQLTEEENKSAETEIIYLKSKLYQTVEQINYHYDKAPKETNTNHLDEKNVVNISSPSVIRKTAPSDGLAMHLLHTSANVNYKANEKQLGNDNVKGNFIPRKPSSLLLNSTAEGSKWVAIDATLKKLKSRHNE